MSLITIMPQFVQFRKHASISLMDYPSKLRVFLLEVSHRYLGLISRVSSTMLAFAPGQKYRLPLHLELIVSCKLNSTCSILWLEKLNEAEVPIEARHSVFDCSYFLDRHISLERCFQLWT